VPNILRGDWEFYNLYFNASSSEALIDPTPWDFMLTPQDYGQAVKYDLGSGSAEITYWTPKRNIPIKAILSVTTSPPYRFNMTLLPVINVGSVMYRPDIRFVRVFNSSDYTFYLYTSNVVDHNAWEDGPNFVVVANITTGEIVGNYSFGQPIAQYDNFAVAKASNWDRDVILINDTVGGNLIKLPQYWADNTNTFYVTEFSEQSINMRFEQNNQMGQPSKRNLSSTPYYMLIYDELWDGNKVPNKGKMTSRVNNSLVDFSIWGPETNEMTIGEQWGYPFLINSFNYGTKVASIFTQQNGPLWKGENTTAWIGAKEFNGRPVAGNASVISAKAKTYDKMGMAENDISIDGGYSVLDSMGNAYVPLNIWNQSMGDYSLKIKITSSATGKSEMSEVNLYVMDPDNMYGGGSKDGGSGECREPPCEGGEAK
jgi:hypothetical protein